MGPIARITMGNLKAVIFWDDTRRQADIYDESRGGLENVDTLVVGQDSDVLVLISKVVRYGEHLGLPIDEYAVDGQ